MKKIFRILKKIVVALCLLYSFNIVTNGIGFIIPINYYTIGTITFLGIPGLIGLVVLYKML